MGLIPGRGTKISHAMRSVAKKERNTSLREDQQGSCGFKIHQLEVVVEIKEVDSHPKRVQGKHGDVGDTLWNISTLEMVRKRKYASNRKKEGAVKEAGKELEECQEAWQNPQGHCVQQPRRRAVIIKMLMDTQYGFTAAETGVWKWGRRAPALNKGPGLHSSGPLGPLSVFSLGGAWAERWAMWLMLPSRGRGGSLWPHTGYILSTVRMSCGWWELRSLTWGIKAQPSAVTAWSPNPSLDGQRIPYSNTVCIFPHCTPHFAP